MKGLNHNKNLTFTSREEYEKFKERHQNIDREELQNFINEQTTKEEKKDTL